MNKKSKRQLKYDKSHTTRVSLKLNNKTDKDILMQLAKVPSKQGYIKECIRKEMNK